MATGAPALWSLLVQWDGTNFVDETADLQANTEVVITRGRGSSADDIQTGVLTGVFDNTDGGKTPDNPLSPLWPYLNDTEARTRFSVTIGGLASFRHRGRISIGTPSWPGGDASKAVVPFASIGRLGQLSQDTLTCDFVARHQQIAETQTVDIWPLDEVVDGATATFRNVGSGTAVGKLVRAPGGAGQVVSADVSGIDLEASVTLTPTSTFVGPVLQLPTSVASGSVGTVVVPFKTADRVTAGGADKYLISAYTSTGFAFWTVRLVDNAGQTDLNVYDGAGAFVGTLYYGFAPGSGSTDGADDRWFILDVRWITGSASTQFYLWRAEDGVLIGACNSTNTALTVTGGITLGGLMSPAQPGKQSRCVAATFGASVISQYLLSGFAEFTVPNALTTLQDRFNDLNLYANFPSSNFGTRNRPVRRKSLSGRDPLEVIAELCRTTGAVVVESRVNDDSLFLFDADQQRLSTVALTVDISEDVDGSNGFPTRKGGTPSLVTAEWTGGKSTYQDTSRRVVSKSVVTCAADDDGARDVASALVNAGQRLRIEKLRIDIAGSSSSLWPVLKDMEIGARIRVLLGTPGSPFVTQYGVTYVDVYAVGWEEHYTFDSAWWEIDTEPADDPVEGITDDTVYGRVAADSMTAAPGTLSGTAGTGTVVVTTVSGLPLSTAAADYPADFSYGGERVTVTSAPASAVSPQTVTVTARGVAPSVGKTHSGSESFDVWAPATASW